MSDVAAAKASAMVVHGAASLPSLEPSKLASTNCVAPSMGAAPQRPRQGATSRQEASPGKAIVPSRQGAAGRAAVHPPSAASNPAPHASGGIPAARHAPPSPEAPPGAHPLDPALGGGATPGLAARAPS